MKKQTKKEIWYWMIMGVGVLLILTIAYGARKDQSNDKQTDNHKKEVNSANQEEVDQETVDNEEKDEPAMGGSSEMEYKQSQSGGEIGQSYLLSDLAIKSVDGNARLVVYLLPKKEKVLPKWTTRHDGDQISVSLSDTSNYDIVTGSKTYTGKQILTANNQIREVEIDTSTGDQISLNITTDRQRSYKVRKVSSPLRLLIEVY
jgi:hypothetical protein